MKKRYSTWPIIYLFFSISLLFFYSCSHSSDNSGKTQTTNSAETANKESASSSFPGEGARHGLTSHYNTTTGGEPRSSANHPPTVDKAKLQLEYVNNKDIVRVVAGGTDKDGDEVTLGYEWFRNGEPAGEGDTISEFRRGDKLSVKIIPFDDKDYGSPKTLSMEINNCPPKINEYKEIKFDGNTYIGKIEASDPDGDPLTYSIKSAPPDMTVDPSTGLVKWNVPPDFKGKASFTASVADGHGGEATQDLSFGILPQQKKEL
jgi:hypothetical protein